MFVRMLTVGGTALMSLVLLAGDGEAAKAKGKGKKKDPDTIFKKLDTNNDNQLSKDEFSKFGKKPGKSDKLFGKLDADNNGSISKTEFEKIKDLKKKKKNK